MGPSAALVEDAGCLGHIRQQEGVGSREGFLKQGLSLNKERWGKAEGKEILKLSDQVKFFLSDETYGKFEGLSLPDLSEYKRAYDELKGIRVVY